MATSILETYLQRYAAPEHSQIERLLGAWWATVVIPACDEPTSGVQATLASLERAAAHSHRHVLVVLVVNGRSALHPRAHQANADLLAWLEARIEAPIAPCASGRYTDHLDLMILDHARPSRRFGLKDGVGRARRIGCDVAAALFARGDLSCPTIWTTDADAQVPPDYFEHTTVGGQHVALTYPFWHTLESDEHGVALAKYEIGLRLHLLGLERARSPYAFHTVGSTLAFDVHAYATVRGVPRRQAGEDFYLLNKLAKVGGILRVDAGPVVLAGRPSTRVPFGTGPAIVRISAAQRDGRDHHVYNPRIFDVLAKIHRGLSIVSDQPDSLDEAFGAGVFCEEERGALSSIKLREAAGGILTRTHKPHSRQLQLTAWFDAFKTLKMIHALRDAAYPDVPWQTAASHAFEGATDRPGVEDLEGWRRYLMSNERRELVGHLRGRSRVG